MALSSADSSNFDSSIPLRHIRINLPKRTFKLIIIFLRCLALLSSLYYQSLIVLYLKLLAYVSLSEIPSRLQRSTTFALAVSIKCTSCGCLIFLICTVVSAIIDSKSFFLTVLVFISHSAAKHKFVINY